MAISQSRFPEAPVPEFVSVVRAEQEGGGTRGFLFFSRTGKGMPVSVMRCVVVAALRVWWLEKVVEEGGERAVQWWRIQFAAMV